MDPEASANLEQKPGSKEIIECYQKKIEISKGLKDTKTWESTRG